MNAQEITQAIDDRAAPDYGLWRIGITANPSATKQLYKNEDLKDWSEWQADSQDVARAVASHFLDAGMKESEPGVIGEPTYVYIF